MWLNGDINAWLYYTAFCVEKKKKMGKRITPAFPAYIAFNWRLKWFLEYCEFDLNNTTAKSYIDFSASLSQQFLAQRFVDAIKFVLLWRDVVFRECRFYATLRKRIYWCKMYSTTPSKLPVKQPRKTAQTF